MNHRHIILVLMLSASVVSNAYAQMRYFRHADLPMPAKNLLTEQFGRWELFNNVVTYFDSTRTHVGWEYRDVIAGDFNNDGRQDYAALVRLSDSSVHDRGYLVVFFGDPSGFKFQVADTIQYNSDLVLFLQHRGESVENFDTGREFRLHADAVALVIYEKGGWTYYYDKSRFRKFLSAD